MSGVKRNNLYAPTGEGNIYRVSEEIRDKVSRETKLIEDRIRQINLKSRQKVRQEEHERFQAHDRERMKMIGRWKAKYKDSPYKVMNFQKELDRMRREELAEKKRVEELRRQLLLESMTGKYNDKLVDPESLSLVPVVDQLALHYRRHLMDESKVTWESDELDKLGSLEFQEILQKFPKLEKLQHSLAAKELQRKKQQENASIISSDSSSLRPSWYPHKQAFPSTSQSRSKMVDGGGTSSFSGALEYHTPGSQMRALEEDLSVEFGQLPPIQPSSAQGSPDRSPISQASMRK